MIDFLEAFAEWVRQLNDSLFGPRFHEGAWYEIEGLPIPDGEAFTFTCRPIERPGPRRQYARPIPLPADLPGERRTIGGEAGTTPAEYLVGASLLYPGRPTFRTLVQLDLEALVALTKAGGRLWLTLDGGEVPWSIEVAL